MQVFHLMHAEYALNDLALSRLKVARISDLNDPFELLAANLGHSRELRQAVRSWRQQLNETRGLLCFSKDWRNPVLWSHYADKHRGICLSFDLADKFAEAVDYLADRIQLFQDQQPLVLDEATVRRFLKTKFHHWHYENEVRVFVDLKGLRPESGVYFQAFSDTLKLREVILGPLCEIPIESVRELVAKKYEGVRVLKARLAFKFFSVVPDERSLSEKYVFPSDKSEIPPAEDVQPVP